jgi:hypothetical protein
MLLLQETSFLINLIKKAKMLNYKQTNKLQKIVTL